MRKIAFCGVRQSLAIDSDHVPLLASINLGSVPKPTVRPQQQRVIRPDLSALNDSSLKAEFASNVAARIASVPPPGLRVSTEALAAALRDHLMDTAVEVLGKQRRRSPDWFERCKGQILAAIDARNQAQVAFNRSPRNQALKVVLQRTRRAVKALVRDAKREEKLRILSALNGDNNNGQNQGAYWEALKQLQSIDKSLITQRQAQMYANAAGVQSVSPQENADNVKAHLHKVYNIVRHRPPSSAATIESVTQRPVRNEFDLPPSIAEVKDAILSAKNRKATSNHVPAELYKAATDEPSFVALITALIKQFWTLQPFTAADNNEATLGVRREFDLSTQASRRAALKQARVENSRVSFLQENPKTGQSRTLYDCYKGARNLHEAAALGCDAARQRWDLDHASMVFWYFIEGDGYLCPCDDSASEPCLTGRCCAIWQRD